MTAIARTPTIPNAVRSPSPTPWLFSRGTDLAVFGGSAALSVALVAVGASYGLLDKSSPEWIWLSCILAVDVAHVWSTLFRVYLDPEEVRRRRLLYIITPLCCFALGALVHAWLGPPAFWRSLAYLAVFHFVRQQAGWVTLYRRRSREDSNLDKWIDTLAIYTATVFPLLWWHGHLPRQFHWFVEDDFVTGLSAHLTSALEPLYWLVLAAFVARQVHRIARNESVNWGKLLVVLSTWTCWWLGIIALDSDFAFTVTNVLIHGIPYLALTFHYGRRRAATATGTPLARILALGFYGFAGTVLLLAFGEEWLWDRLVWHDRPWLFGSGLSLPEPILSWVVPVLAVPQLTHYVLDGAIWRRAENPDLRRYLP